MKILKVLAAGVAVVGIGVTTTLTANADTWRARSVDEIKADIAKTNGKEYTIAWGDTLSGISAATNITVDALAQRNSIENVDLIYAGNKLIFEGNVVTVQNNQGETVAQTVIKPEEKVDPAKKVGEPVNSTGKSSGSKSNTSTSNSSSTAGGNSASSSNGNTTGSTSSTENTNTGGSTSNTGNTNNSGSTSNTGNSSTGGSTSNTGSTNTGGSTSNSGNSNTGGSSSNTQTPSVPSEKPVTPTEPTTPSKPAEPTIVSGSIGNTGLVFNTKEEANAYGYEKLNAGEISRFEVIGIFYSDGSEKASLSFF